MSMSEEVVLMSLEDVLKAWKLDQYLANFREHCIDIDELESLLDPSNERVLYALVPVLAHAVRLKNNIKGLMEQTNDKSGGNNDKQTTSSDNAIPGNKPTTSGSHADMREAEVNLNLSESVAGSSDNISASNPTPDKQDKQPSVTGRKRSRENDEATHSKVREVLLSTGQGRALLARARSSARLTDHDQNKLCEVVVDAAMVKGSGYKLKTGDFERLVEDILGIFPDEKAATYYIPYKNNGRAKYAAKGKLVMKYQAVRRYLRLCGEITASNNNGGGDDDDDDDDDNDDDKGVEGLEEKLQYLHQNLDDWATITEYWKDTSKFRIHNLRHTPHLLSRSKKPRKGEEAAAASVTGYIALFPCLKDVQGYQLFIIDFDLEYPGYKNAIFSGWNNFISKALNALKAIEKPCEALRDSLTLLEDDFFEQETNDLIVLLNLGYLDTVVTVTRVQKDKKYTTWRPSQSEIQQGLISLVETDGKLETFILERTEKFEKWKLPVQPFCVAVGPSVDDISKCVVVLDKRTKFEFNNAQRALDVCFKILHAAFARYSDEAHRLWMLVQLQLYQLKTKFDNIKEDAQLPKLLAKFE